MTHDEIIAKLLKVEALFHGTDVAGEKQAAQSAMDRLNAQLGSVPEPPAEYQFSLPDPWKRKLFLALVRRHGLKPYRLPRQRYSTVMLNVSRSHLDRVLWPEYLELSKLLEKYLEEATTDIISRGVHGDLSEAAEQPNLPSM
ncbi:hypothetical protein [Haloferula sargassicola]|uniref:hypothetical protein n=1 Tax=Haloferula sargassicola TaxID=490096 RepID=UPI0033654AF3